MGDRDTDGDSVPARPRLCHLTKWTDFDGYGFNLHAEKSKPGQYIGKVDEGSPAEAAGLKTGDRIVEVNGVNINNENHKQVVQRIKAVPDETKLLVADAETDAYYKERDVVIKGTMAAVLYVKTPLSSKAASNPTPPATPPSDSAAISASKMNGNRHHDANDAEDRRSQTSDRSSVSSTHGRQERTSDKASSHGSTAETPSTDRRGSPCSSPDSAIEREDEKRSGESPSPSPSPSPAPPMTGNKPGLNLNMTAQEMREQLSRRKKYDPKKENMDMRKKYEIVQTL